jgi:hypothetical protein
LRRQAAKRKIAVAIAYNRAHAEAVSEFDALTGGIAAKGIRAIMTWQRAHGVPADGKIGDTTVRAAKAGGAARGEKTARVEFADDEAASDDSAEHEENPAFEDNVFGQHAGMEHAKDDALGEALDKGGEAVEQVGKLGAMTGGGSGPESLVKLAQAPATIQKLREGKYVEVFKDVAKGVDPGEAAEALAHVAEKLGLRGAAGVFEKIAAYGTEINVLIGLASWTWEGFKKIHEAHESGDTENRIDLYADSYAHAFLFGEAGGGQAGLRAATAEEHEAVELGRKEGAAAAGATGELATAIGQELLRRCGDANGAARHIKRYLLEQAGLGHQAKARTGEGP